MQNPRSGILRPLGTGLGLEKGTLLSLLDTPTTRQNHGPITQICKYLWHWPLCSLGTHFPLLFRHDSQLRRNLLFPEIAGASSDILGAGSLIKSMNAGDQDGV